jgi:alkanesulfonate monooxygenase SsuD/methylene tetrahydromethanopterin reductase-like flavin-dependent oxidoreductase (luciferase family)
LRVSPRENCPGPQPSQAKTPDFQALRDGTPPWPITAPQTCVHAEVTDRRLYRKPESCHEATGFTGQGDTTMKKIGFLSFGHWTPSPQSQTRSAADALLQSIDLAVAAEELGADGAYFRVHHFARQLASPFPLLAAIGAKTSRIEIGTAVIDMRYENPLYMAEDAGAADLIAGGRLQLGISRGSPEQVIDGWRHFGYQPAEGESDSDMARRHAEVFLDVLRGEGFAQPNPRPMFPNPPGLLRVEPHSDGLRERIWWGASSNATAVWAAKLGMNLQSSTLKDDETGLPFHVQQADQIRAYREAWKAAGHAREPRVSVSRSIFALVDDRDRAYFGGPNHQEDKIGFIDDKTRAIFGRSYAASPDVLAEQLAKDEAIAEADTLLLTVPNQLGVDYNAHVIEAFLTHVAPALGWR